MTFSARQIALNALLKLNFAEGVYISLDIGLTHFADAPCDEEARIIGSWIS